MELGKNKKAIFFSSDAMIALTIIFITLLIAYPVVISSKPLSHLQSDIIVSFSSLAVGDIENAYVKSLISQGLIQNPSKSVLEQIGEFYVTNQSLAKALASSLLEDLKTSRNIGIWYDNKLIASRNSSSYESSNNVEMESQVISGIQEGKNITGYLARAYLSSSSQSKYFYFGGYIGDGNITFNVDYNGNISSAELEIAINNNFSIYINNNFIGYFNKSDSEYIPKEYNIPTTYLSSGNNSIRLVGDRLRISGGFFKLSYLSNVEYEQPTRYLFPGIEGVINLYDGFYVPNTLTSLKIYLHMNNSYKTFLTIGNTTVYNNTPTGETIINLDNAYLSSKIDYNQISNKTIPLRLGLENISYGSNFTGNADVILITDTSGSMDWRLNQDSVIGTDRNCSDINLNSSSTKRISLARCLDKQFVETILGGNGNRIGLVSFSTDANSYVALTNNLTLLNNTINGYVATGSTCISCAINRAYAILNSSGSSNRSRYILVMTDGVPNIRSTPSCYDINDISNSTISIEGVGDAGAVIEYKSSWNSLTSLSASNALYGVDMINSSLGFAVGSSGKAYRYSGSSWSEIQDLGSNDINSIDMLSFSLGFAVGESSKFYRYSGSTWSEIQDLGNNALYGVDMINSSLGFAVGSSGKIYKYAGSSWTEVQDLGSNNINSVDMFNSSLGFAVGSSGKIYKYNGSSWNEVQDLGSMTLTKIKFFNSTLAYLTSNGGDIYKYTGSTWTIDYSGTYTLNTISLFNSSLGFAVGDSRAGVITLNQNSWSKSFQNYLFSGTSTTGISCNDDDSCSLSSSIPMLNSNYSSCRAHDDLNVTIHSVGFGPIATCSLATKTLQAIASCGNGSSIASTDPSLLQQFYEQVADSILRLSYAEQISETSANITTTKLYDDSYIEFSYAKQTMPYGLMLTLEKQFYNNYFGNFSMFPNSSLVDAKVVSYSGPRWTALVSINNNAFYNLTKYGINFVGLGDPYKINIPLNLVNLSSLNTIKVETGTTYKNITSGSQSDKIIYTFVKNLSSFSSIVYTATGCLWNIEFESGLNSTINIPADYSGTDLCYYSSSRKEYNLNDAFQVAAYNLLKQLDVDSNNKIDVDLNSQSLQLSLSQVSGIPYKWNTEVQVRTWD